MFGQSSAAAALDAADGRIDGQFFGRPIVQAGAPAAVSSFGTPVVGGVSSFGGFGATSNAAALDAADGVIDGKFYGRQIVQQQSPVIQSTPIVQSTPFVQSQPVLSSFGTTGLVGGYSGFSTGGSSALALDAADGKIDGQFFGRPIVQAGGVRSFGTPVVGGVMGGAVGSSALALDAADGKIDGQFFGRPIVQQSAVAMQPQIIQSPQIIQTPQIIQSAPAVGSQALALDAADGKIDGKFFGRQIVQGGPQIIQGGPQIIQGAQFVQRPVQGATSSALALDAADGKIDGKFFGRQIVQAGAAPAPVTSSALALDAADGRIDGKFFGRQIVQGGPPQGGAGAAAALDAADGVMDGRFYGRPIVQARK